MAYLTQRQEKKLLKHIEKWGIPFNRYKITWEDQKEFTDFVMGPYLYFNTEKYQARFYGFEDNLGGIDNIVKRQFELRTEYARSLNKDEPHIRNAINKGINCIQGSANNIPFEDSTFEVVHCRHVIKHMEDFAKPINEMIRVSKYLVLISFFIEPLESGQSQYSLDNEGTEYEIYHNRYSKKNINEILIKNPKVKKFKYSKLPDPSKTLLKIYLN